MYDFDEFEDFYGEPGEYDQMIDDLKRTLMRSVKREINDEMDRLKAENAELQEVKEKWEDLVGEYREKELKMKYTLVEERRKIARMRLADIFEACGMNVMLYKPDPNLVYGPKCDKCDENRNIHFNSPSGRELTERCECGANIWVYAPKRYNLVRFYMDEHNDRKVVAFYKKESANGHDDFEACSIRCKEVCSQDDFDTIYAKYKSAAFFADEEKCKAYCDYINAVNKVPEAVLEIARKSACCDQEERG